MDKTRNLASAAARIKAETRPTRSNIWEPETRSRFEFDTPEDARRDYVSVSVLLPPELHEAVARETARRKTQDAARSPEEKRHNTGFSDVVCDAVAAYLLPSKD